jgi:hypothetical protein
MLRNSCVRRSVVVQAARSDKAANFGTAKIAEAKILSHATFRSCSRHWVAAAVILGAICFDSGALAADQPLSSQIDAVAKALTADAAKDPAAQTALNALVGLMAKLDCDADPSKNVACKIATLKILVSNWKANLTQDKVSSLSIQEQNDLWSALDALITVPVGPAEKPGDGVVTKPIDFAAGHLGTTMPSHDPIGLMGSLDKLTSASADAIKAANPGSSLSKADQSKLAAISADVVQRIEQGFAVPNVGGNIHVTGSWFGDLGEIDKALKARGLKPTQSGRRFCAATAAIRAFCENKPQCYEPPLPKDQVTPATAFPDGNVADISGTKLCGYEPAPYADAKNIGLLATYDCVAIAEVPAPQAPQSVHRSAILRYGAYDSITCQGTAP